MQLWFQKFRHEDNNFQLHTRSYSIFLPNPVTVRLSGDSTFNEKFRIGLPD
jgi:hypothetical protein